MKSVDIVIATHKKYAMPKNKYYIPLQVGAAINNTQLNIKTDNTGKNISEKNLNFCELTGLYWIWKNSEADYKGLVHYRRHFTLKKGYIRPKNRMNSVLNEAEIKKLTEEYDVILPKKRNYRIETLWDHYVHTLYPEPLEKTREIIKKKYPEYLKEFDNLKTRKSAHMFNMLIAKKEIFDEYSKWLFDILFELEESLKTSKKEYDTFHSRFYGRISELLFDVWLYTKHPDDLKIKELRVLDIEGVNWFKKGSSFLAAKFFGKKYKKSF